MAPWNSDADSSKKNHRAVGRLGVKWRKTANAVLRETGDDARAIKVANRAIMPKRRLGKKRAK